MDDELQCLTAKEAAAYLRVSVATLRRLVRKDLLPHVRIGTRPLYRFNKQRLDEYLRGGFQFSDGGDSDAS